MEMEMFRKKEENAFNYNKRIVPMEKLTFINKNYETRENIWHVYNIRI